MALTVATRITRTEIRRTIRILAGSRTKVALLAVAILFGLGPITALGVSVLPALGERVAAGAISEVAGVTIRDAAAGATALGWLMITVMATMRTVTTRGDVDEPACLLLSTSTRSVVAGLISTEIALFAIWFVPPVAILAGAFSAGAGSVVPLLVALGLLTLLLLTAIPTGFVVGLSIRHLLTTYEPIARFKTPLFVLVGIAYFGAIASGWFDRLVAVLFELLGNSPFGWPGELLLFVVPGLSPRPVALVGTALVVTVGAPLALAASTVLATHHWYADEVRTDDARDVRSSNRLESALSAIGDRAVRTVAVTTIRRAKRAPVKLLYVAYPLFGVLAFGEEIVSTGTVSPSVAVALCAYVVWASGALFTLNVLGDYGAALPTVLTTPTSGRQAVSGTIVAGTLVAVPVALVASVALGLVSPLSLRSTGILAAGTVVGAVAAPVLATGIGALFPRFGSVRISSNREAVMPSKSAFVSYTLALVLPSVAALVLYTDGAADVVATVVSVLVSLVPALDLTVGSDVIVALAWFAVALGVIGPGASFAYATRRFDRLELD